MLGVREDNQFQSSENSLVDRMQTTSHASQLMRQLSVAVPFSRCMKAVLMMLLVCVVFSLGFVMGRLNVGTTSSAQSDALKTKKPSTPECTPTATTTPEGTELQTHATTLPQCTPVQDPATPTPAKQRQKEEWERNKDRLVSLGCRPRPTAVKVTSQGSQTLHPTHLVVDRCLNNLSFCGTSRFGYANEESAGEMCLPSLYEMEDFQVMYFVGGGQVTQFVRMEVHKNCSCKIGTKGKLND